MSDKKQQKIYSGVYTLLKNSGYMSVHRYLIQSIGFDEALLLQLLIDKYEYFKEKKFLREIDGKDWFYAVSDYIEIETEFDRKRQKKAFDNLAELGLIETKLIGMPRKKYFHINMSIETLNKFLVIGEESYKVKMQTLKNPVAPNDPASCADSPN